MFPDLRQMIAAVLGSIVALICGFGLFAAFRISHEPLARLPTTTALQLAAEDAVNSPKGFVPGQSFDQRFRIGTGSLGPSTAGAPVIATDRPTADPETTTGTAPPSAEPDLASRGGDKTPPRSNEQTDLQSSSSEKVPEASTSSDPQPSPPSAAPTDTAGGKASEPAVPNETPVAANSPADATTAPTDTARSMLQTTAEAAHQSSETQIPQAPGATGVSITSLNDRASDNAQPRVPQTAQPDQMETKRKNARRARGIVTAARARDSGQTFATQPNFQAPPTHVVQRPARIRKVASDNGKVTNTGVGGPLVSPPKP